ncbi:MAG TPA: GNAT family N-acetyltransferase [Alphaproteobacteria bacterium]|nr:GNAT family N-acetyltransferase [Alphaproteobacteria bacterium]
MVNRDHVTLFKNQFTLPKTGAIAMIQILGPEHLPGVLALQDATRRALPAAQKNFVLPQSADYFEQFLTRAAGLMIGVLCDDELIGQMAVMGPLSLDEMAKKQAVTRNEVKFHHVGLMDAMAVAKSMAVHPDYRGNEISQHLLAAALETPLAQSVDHVFAQISAENAFSWDLFLRNGFGIIGAAIDPGDRRPRFILQKPVHGFVFERGPSADEVDPAADFTAIVRLTQREGLVGRLDEMAGVAAPRLAFLATTDVSVPLPLAAGQGE